MLRLYVGLIALIYASLGLACTLAPGPMLATLDIRLPTGLAVTDARATYGGMELGIAAGLWLVGNRDLTLAAKVAGVGLLFVGTTRLIGIVVDDGGTPMMWSLLGLEWSLGVVGLWLGRDVAVD